MPRSAIEAMKPVVELASAIVYGRFLPGAGSPADPASALVEAAGTAVQGVRIALESMNSVAPGRHLFRSSPGDSGIWATGLRVDGAVI